MTLHSSSNVPAQSSQDVPTTAPSKTAITPPVRLALVPAWSSLLIWHVGSITTITIITGKAR